MISGANICFCTLELLQCCAVALDSKRLEKREVADCSQKRCTTLLNIEDTSRNLPLVVAASEWTDAPVVMSELGCQDVDLSLAPWAQPVWASESNCGCERGYKRYTHILKLYIYNIL